MKTLIIKGYKVQIYYGYLGISLYIIDAAGTQIHSQKVSSNPVARAEEVINQQ